MAAKKKPAAAKAKSLPDRYLIDHLLFGLMTPAEHWLFCRDMLRTMIRSIHIKGWRFSIQLIGENAEYASMYLINNGEDDPNALLEVEVEVISNLHSRCRAAQSAWRLAWETAKEVKEQDNE